MIDLLLRKDLLPDRFVRQSIRYLLAQRLREESKVDQEKRIAAFREAPIAVQTEAANEQHYEVPTEFFQCVLGKHLKYSSGWWERSYAQETAEKDLDEAEAAMLELCSQRAELQDDQEILELGCGWGSWTLFMAERYPKSRITAVSNSKTQKVFIDEQARLRGLKNVQVLTADMNVFQAPSHYDRVVSVEMFEHMRNHEKLMARISEWMKPGGKLFVHIFVHRRFTYLFEPKDATDWMSRYFFSGGMMPAADYLLRFQKHLRVEQQWKVNGTHYQKTAEAWLRRMDLRRDKVFPLLAATYGAQEAVQWWAYWRIFFMSCAELWGYRGGDEWFVGHYRFVKP